MSLTARLLALPLAALCAASAAAQELHPSRSDWGGIGLLQTPTARFDTPGRLTTGYTALGSVHRHLALDVALMPWLEVGLRSTLYPSWFGIAEPGVDARIRLLREGPWWPALAIGGRDVTGSGPEVPGAGRFAGEYLVASRRIHAVDLSVGMGWGRQGGYGHLRNPLAVLGGRYARDRDPFDPRSRGPAAWFTGDRVALFGGVEWHTPVDGLSLKLEYSGDSFRSEQQDDPAFVPGLPVNVGLAYRPWHWLDVGAAFEQGHRVMLRASLTLDPAALSVAPPLPPPPRMEGRPSAGAAGSRDAYAEARTAGLPVRAVRFAGTPTLWLEPDPGRPAAPEVGRAARVLADGAPPDVEAVTVVTAARGLDGVALTLRRRAIEAAARRRGSAEEIWRDARVDPAGAAGPPPHWPVRWDVALRPTMEQSLSEHVTPLAWRAYQDVSLAVEPLRGVVLGGGLRINLANTLDLLNAEVLPAPYPVRSDAALYARPPAVLEHAHVTWLGTPRPDWHARLSAGYLEEMFGGLSAEVLHKPARARWGLGLELARVWKRPPGDPLRVWTDIGITTGHAAFHLDSADARTGVTLRLGRYLGGDAGGTLELIHRFAGGARLSAHATWTDGPREGQSVIGGRLDHGIVLTLPLQASGWLPPDSAVRVTARTLGRDAGQRLRPPLPLAEVLEPAGYGALAGSWRDITR
ncbi:YjbH domain-containing protein [Azospirillum halopraeferens]|uniref:YjbH domain-containing protein n=1 Tax=Azospirillum halopraeferens TaxID=34010 RepID=UPI00040AC2A0|nr:YjbH domain-containing protein [Azospirillum halopraeferens]